MAGNRSGHALVVGARGRALQGVEHDVREMAAMLGARGLEVEVRTGDRATRDGILAGYEWLIANAQRDQPAVFYYSGHGFTGIAEDEPSKVWQGISPSDVRDSRGDHDFRGITSWELSILQARLTARTRNVTAIFDCCHASQMARSVTAGVARCLPHPIRVGLAAHLRALRARHGTAATALLGNPDAVRLVACAQDETAFEYETAGGQFRGAFTEALLEVLSEVGDAYVSWALLDGAIRDRVMRRFPIQRPDIDGPASRQPFALTEVGTGDVVAISGGPTRFRIAAGRLVGVHERDVYRVVPMSAPPYSAANVVAEVEVSEAFATFSYAALREWRGDHRALPVDALAIPIEKTGPRYPVALEAPAGVRDAVERAIVATRRLRVAPPGEPVLASLVIAGAGVTIEDRIGPLYPIGAFPEHLQRFVDDLARLAAAQRLRELEGEYGVAASEVEIEWGAVVRGEPRRMPDSGGSLALGDRLYVKVTSRARRPLYAHVFNVGLRGQITSLTGKSVAAGAVLHTAGAELILGRNASGRLEGIRIFWPQGMPRAGVPRCDGLIVIVTAQAAALRGLEIDEHVGPVHEEARPFGDLLAGDGGAVARSGAGGIGAIDGFLARHLSYELHPRAAAIADTAFEIDDDPLGQSGARAPESWLAPAPPPSPGVIAIALVDLAIGSCERCSGELRVDALICTRAAGGAAGHAAWTRRFHGVAAGDRLALDGAPLFRGAVNDFVDVYLWISRDAGAAELAELLAARSAIPELADAAASLAVAGDPARPWVTAAGGSAIIARIAHDLLRGAAGTPIALYRNSFLACEQFGVGRYPTVGHYRAREFCLALQIDAVSPGGGAPACV